MIKKSIFIFLIQFLTLVYCQSISVGGQTLNIGMDKKEALDLMHNFLEPYNLKTGKENFFEGMSFSKEEIDFLISKMFLKITIFHPINKTELVCSGKVNDYELN